MALSHAQASGRNPSGALCGEAVWLSDRETGRELRPTVVRALAAARGSLLAERTDVVQAFPAGDGSLANEPFRRRCAFEGAIGCALNRRIGKNRTAYNP